MTRQKKVSTRIKLAMIAAFFISSFYAVLPTTYAFAADTTVSCVESKDTSFRWSKDGCTSTQDLINTIFAFLGSVVGIAVVGGIVYGGILYATANGNSSKTQQGISVIVNAVIGLLLYIFMYALTSYIVPGGLFG